MIYKNGINKLNVHFRYQSKAAQITVAVKLKLGKNNKAATSDLLMQDHATGSLQIKFAIMM